MRKHQALLIHGLSLVILSKPTAKKTLFKAKEIKASAADTWPHASAGVTRIFANWFKKIRVNSRNPWQKRF